MFDYIRENWLLILLILGPATGIMDCDGEEKEVKTVTETKIEKTIEKLKVDGRELATEAKEFAEVVRTEAEKIRNSLDGEKAESGVNPNYSVPVEKENSFTTDDQDDRIGPSYGNNDDLFGGETKY